MNRPKPTAPSLLPEHLRALDRDRELFDRTLRSFIPPGAFDAHAHLYRARDVATADGEAPGNDAPGNDAGYSEYLELTRGWMGDLAPRDGVFFAMPGADVDAPAANEFLFDQVARRESSRALLLVRPTDDPAAVESAVRQRGFAGFKVYHVYSPRRPTMDSAPAEFLPEWLLEIADRYELVVMLHLVRSRALADASNQSFLADACRRYGRARIVLAHAARGFCCTHTVEGIDAVRGHENVYFDTSAVCEPAAFEAIVRACGTRRLLYGSDFPVSSLRGRASTLGDGFVWLYGNDFDWSSELGEPTLVGIESLLALKTASTLVGLRDADMERLFIENARDLFGLSSSDDRNTRKDEDGQTTYRAAKKIIPGGMQLLSKRPEIFAPERWPPYFAEAHGVEIIDVDGRRFTDMSNMSVGACLLGYGDPDVNAAVSRRVALGGMSSLSSVDEAVLAEMLLELHPWAGGARFARGGGEALAVAVRIARATTGREVVAFCGYHGWNDWYLAANLASDSTDPLKAHLLPGLEPTGVPRGLAGSAIPFRYNDADGLRAVVKETGDRLAAIVLEPTRHEAPAEGFLETVRALADETGAVMVFDEVSSGWRFHVGGVHMKFGVHPDMAVFAKATGNGYPVSAIIGREQAMDGAQRSFISSTFWTDGIGPAAAIAAIGKMQRIDVCSHVDGIGLAYREGLGRIASEHGLPLQISGHPALTYTRFDHPDADALQTLWTARMLERGFLVASGFYPSLAHEERHVSACLDATREVFAELREAIDHGDAETRLGTPVKHTGFRRLA